MRFKTYLLQLDEGVVDRTGKNLFSAVQINPTDYLDNRLIQDFDFSSPDLCIVDTKGKNIPQEDTIQISDGVVEVGLQIFGKKTNNKDGRQKF